MKLGLSQLRTGLQKVIWDASSSEIKPMTETEKKRKRRNAKKAIESKLKVPQGQETSPEVAGKCW